MTPPEREVVLLEQAAQLYERDRISVEQLERACDAALSGDRDAYHVATGLDPYAGFVPVPLPPMPSPSGLGVRETR